MNPFLDVTEPLTDPDFATDFGVLRRVETIGTNGRNTFAVTTFPNVVGVITSGSSNDRDAREAFEVTPRQIVVVTQFELQGEITGSQPDIVVWRGSPYLVIRVDPYGHFGPGFYEAECRSTQLTDPAILSGIAGLATGTVVAGSMTNFNVKQNTMLGALCC